MQQTQSKKVSENPFYGKRAMLDMFQQVSKMTDNVNKTSVFGYLDKAFKEAITQVEKEMFFTLMFSLGDITNREHNLLQRRSKEVEAGGNSLRRVFIYSLQWLVEKDLNQFIKFLPIIGEYTNLENPFMYQVRSDRRTGKIIEVISIVPTETQAMLKFTEAVTEYFSQLIRNSKTTEMEHGIIAKFLRKPRFSQRTRKVVKKSGETIMKKYRMQPDTFKKEKYEEFFAKVLSTKMGWEVIEYPQNAKFKGLEQYKAKYGKMSEAHLFSSKEILNWDKDQFTKWLDTLPSSARFRTQCRLMDEDGKSKGKWIGKFGDLAIFYQAWLNQKESANKEVKQLELKAKTTKLSDEEAVKLTKATKDAKVNTGAETLLDQVAKLFKEGLKTEVDAIADNILRKMDIKVPVLVVADTSGSMASRSLSHQGVSFCASDMCRLAATAFLTKNTEVEQMLITFDTSATILVAGNEAESKTDNRFMKSQTKKVESLINPVGSFSDNYKHLSQFIYSTGGGTDLSTIPKIFKRWTDEVPEQSEGRKEMINQYPVMLVISDGDINQNYSATASVADFQMKMKQWFGWYGVVVLWDVKQVSVENNKFEGLENVMYFGGCNPQILNQVFCKIDDLDVIDIYTPLLSLYKSKRYEPVKELVA